MTFCPSSTESQTHKRVIAAVADRAVKTQKVKLLNTICEDDEKARIERIKVYYIFKKMKNIKIEEEKLRAFERMDLKRQQRKERNLNESRLSTILLDAENEQNKLEYQRNTIDNHDNYDSYDNYEDAAQEIFGSDSSISSDESE